MNETAEDKASWCVQHCQNAAGEIGFMVGQNPENFPEYADRFNKFKENGASNVIAGDCLADSLYDDSDFLQALIGDEINGFEHRTAVLNILENHGAAYQKAVEALRR